jgi:hypothetical protein
MNEYGIVVDRVSVLVHNTYKETLDRTTNRTLDAIRNGVRRRGMDAGKYLKRVGDYLLTRLPRPTPCFIHRILLARVGMDTVVTLILTVK